MFTKRHNPFPIIGPYAGIYAHGVEVSSNTRTLYVSGQVGQNNDGLIADGFEAQARQAMTNVLNVLKQAGMTYDNIIKMNFYLTDAIDIETLVKVRKELIDGTSPAITTLIVAGLAHPDWSIEIEVIAADQQEKGQ